jgi:hypothetical protein
VCNPSYSKGRDQEDHQSKPALDKEFPRPYLKIRAGGVVQGVGPVFKLQYHNKKKKKRKKRMLHLFDSI